MSTVWISPDGDDANPGTKEQPLVTLRAAYAALPPGGGTVRLHPGNYRVTPQDTPPPGVALIGVGIADRSRWRRLLRRPRRSTTILKWSP
jgi:hypothetical protein